MRPPVPTCAPSKHPGLQADSSPGPQRSFPDFRKPVLLAWASEDRFFPLRPAHRLANDLSNATLRTIDDCYTFIPEEQPEQLVEVILAFVREHARS
jgi:pimeloyl-ACP methyl ester carboxylesterase